MIGTEQLREIVKTTIANRSGRFWYRDGAMARIIARAEPVRHLGNDAVIDAIQDQVMKEEFIFDFDNPCDAWDYFSVCRRLEL